MKNSQRIIYVLVIALLACVANPLEAEAQGWEWIRKLSGPAFTKAVNGRAGFCIFGARRCADGAVGRLFVDDSRLTDERVETTIGQIGFEITYGWDGENSEREIAGVNMLRFEEHLTILQPWPWFVPRVFSVGVGFNRFSGDNIEGSFWRTSLNQTVMWRYYFKDTEQEWFVEGGPKFSYFFNRLNAQDFGGIPEVGVVEGGEMGLAVQIRIGYFLHW